MEELREVVVEEQVGVDKDRPVQSDQLDSQERPEQPEQRAQPEEPELPERLGQPERPERPERPDPPVYTDPLYSIYSIELSDQMM
jgi:hypothetical protein